MHRVLGDFYIVYGTPVLYNPVERLIVFADVHLGYEEYMAGQGVFIPRAQLRYAIRVLDRVFRALGHVKRVVVDGDLKHSFDRLTRQERVEVSEFLEYLLGHSDEVVVVRGNHDNYLSLVLRDYGVDLVERYEVKSPGGTALLVHGHREPADLGEHDIVIIGHEHPSIGLVDSLGLVTKTPCYLKAPLDTGSTLIVLPALGTYQSGTRITLDPDNYLSPITRKHAQLEKATPIAIIEETEIFEMPPLALLAKIIT